MGSLSVARWAIRKVWQPCHWSPEERRGWEGKVAEERMSENFLNLWKDINLQIQEAVWTSNKVNPKKCTPRSIIIKQKTKDKEKKPWKQWARKTMPALKGKNNLNDIRLIRNCETRSEWHIFQVLKERAVNHELSSSYPSGVKGKSRHCWWRKTKWICHQQTYLKQIAKAVLWIGRK